MKPDLIEKIVVVGTGPSAVAAINAIITSDRVPLVIEAGELFQGSVPNRSNMALKTNDSQFVEKSPGKKAWFGSHAPYSKPHGEDMGFAPEILSRSSNFIGGYSRVWGATFEFWNFNADWPSSSIPNSVDLEAVRKLVPHSENALDQNYERKNFRTPRAIKEIFEKLKCNSDGWEIKPAVLAVQTDSQNMRTCGNSGSCLEGCPNDAIWYSGNAIQDWLDQAKIVLHAGMKVKSISTVEGGTLKIVCKNLDGDISTIYSERVFLAAGAIGTAEIALESKVVDKVLIQDTATIFTAAFGFHKYIRGGHKLSQLWMHSPSSQDDKFLAQLYAPDESNSVRLIRQFGKVPFISIVAKLLARQLFPVVAYQDQRHSSKIELSKIDDQIKVRSSGKTSKTHVIRALIKMNKLLIRSRLFIPIIGTDISASGTGHHFGSSFPLGTTSDDLGQINLWENVHIVDSSVLPYLDVGSITPTVMANSHRIARQVMQGLT